ncbi:MAG: GT4 family glycosyltransferase PelF [Clostridiales bacterium]|nr:GT4 family glycosyltransferase PelF [Clostridiales bacterium]
MRICIFSEGSFPYTLGGVSSWINTLIKECPEHEFIIFSINTDSKLKGNYKYAIPDNVVSIYDVFLNDIVLSEKSKGKRYSFNEHETEALTDLIKSDHTDWATIFNLFRRLKNENVASIFMSKNFFDIVRQIYIEKYPYTPFTEFIWTMRSVYLVLFGIIRYDVPPADIYHSVSTGYSGIMASNAKLLYNKPLIISEHGIYTREREEELIKADWVKGYYKDIWIKFFYNLSNCAYSYADTVTSLFNKNKELQIELGCPEDKIQIIPNGIDVNNFSDLPEKEEKDCICIGAIVRVVPIKDIKTMLLAFKHVATEITNTKFFIMGPAEEDKEYAEECYKMAKDLQLNNIIFTGAVDIMEYIGKMDVLVLTSISEGQPLTVLEGMAAKKPHVCTNVGDCKDLLYGMNDVYGQAGYIDYVLNYKGIAEKIIKLCKDPDLRKEFGYNGFNRVSNLYKKETFIAGYKELYNKYGSDY